MRVRIGRVGRPHGIDGAFFVEQPSDDKRWWKTGASFLAGGTRVEVVAHRTSSGRPVLPWIYGLSGDPSGPFGRRADAGRRRSRASRRALRSIT